MKILLDYRPALRQRTGVGEYVHELARALAASSPGPDESIALFSSSWRDRLRPDAIPGTATIDARVPVRVLNYAWHRWEWPSVEAVTRQRFDVVQSAHPLLIPSGTAARIVLICDLDFLDHPERARAEIRRDYPSLAASHAGRADRVIVISKDTAAQVERRLGVPASRISLCVPGAPDWPAREREPATGSILFLGTIEPRKNVARLIEAYERLIALWPQAPKLVLAGGLTPEAEALRARIRSAPLAGRVELPGYVDPDKRIELYRSATVFVLPSLAEGFGMPALEAMTVGVPVIAANRAALPEVVGSAGRLVDPDDTGDLAEALHQVLTDAPLRARMREAGLQQARRFRWSDAARNAREAWALALEARSRRHG